jgi:hypothetical protein
MIAKSIDMNRVKFEGPATYRIVVLGLLDERMSDCLCGMRITSESREALKPVTTLLGGLRDQAQLSGVLSALYEFHLPILSVEILNARNEVKEG